MDLFLNKMHLHKRRVLQDLGMKEKKWMYKPGSVLNKEQQSFIWVKPKPCK